MVSAETVCAPFHKKLLGKRQLMPEYPGDEDLADGECWL
jgi:hypothetical protein